MIATRQVLVVAAIDFPTESSTLREPCWRAWLEKPRSPRAERILHGAVMRVSRCPREIASFPAEVGVAAGGWKPIASSESMMGAGVSAHSLFPLLLNGVVRMLKSISKLSVLLAALVLVAGVRAEDPAKTGSGGACVAVRVRSWPPRPVRGVRPLRLRRLKGNPKPARRSVWPVRRASAMA